MTNQKEQEFRNLLFDRSIQLTRLSLKVLILIVVILSVFILAVQGIRFIGVLMAGLTVYFVITYYLTNTNYVRFARILLIIGLPIMIVGINIGNNYYLMKDRESFSIINFFSGRYFLILSLIVSIILVNVWEKRMFIFSVGFQFILLISFDFLSKFFGVDFYEMGMKSFDYYFSANVYPALGFTFIASSLIFMKYQLEKSEFQRFIINYDKKERLNRLIEFSDILNKRGGDVKEIYHLACKTIYDVLENVNRIGIWSFDERETTLINVSQMVDGEFEDNELYLSSKIYPNYFLELKSDNLLVVPDVGKDDRFINIKEKYLSKFGITSKFDLVVLSENKRICVLSCEHNETREWKVEELMFLRSIGDLVSSIYSFNKLISKQNKLEDVNKQIKNLNQNLEDTIEQRTRELNIRKLTMAKYAKYYAAKINQGVEEVDELFNKAMQTKGKDELKKTKSDILKSTMKLDKFTQRINKSIIESQDWRLKD